MADVDHPKTHVEDQDIDLPRKQPESPKHEGIDPLTESDTMYPRENVQEGAAKFNKKEEKLATENAESEASEKDSTVADQEARNARVNNDAEVKSDKTDKETGTENTSASNKTTESTSQADVKAAEKSTASKTPKA